MQLPAEEQRLDSSADELLLEREVDAESAALLVKSPS
jgi:hypothetical protein